MKRIILTFVVIYSLFAVTACPSKKSLETAFNKSAQVAGLAETAAIATGDFYRQGVLTLEWKDKIAGHLETVVKNGKRFHNAVVAIKQKYNGKITAVPQVELTDLDILFSREVIQPFMDILTEIGLLPPAIANRVMLAFSILKTAIMTISSIFGSGSASYELYLQMSEVKNYAAG